MKVDRQILVYVKAHICFVIDAMHSMQHALAGEEPISYHRAKVYYFDREEGNHGKN